VAADLKPDFAPDTRPRQLLTVAQFAERYPAWSPGALRSLILHADDRVTARGKRIPGNRLPVIRISRRVLLDVEGFFFWVAAQQKTARRPSDEGAD